MVAPSNLAAVITLLMAVVAAIQAGAATVQPQVAGRVMLAAAIDRNGRPTVDVGPDDFVIEEGHDEREVLAVRIADYPIAVLVDNGASTEAALMAIRQAAARFITRIGQRPVSVGTLADPPEVIATFDDERSQVLERLAAIRSAPGRALRPLPAVAQAAGMIAATESPFSVVVVISARPVDPEEQAAGDRFTPVIESGAAVHVIALRTIEPAEVETADLLRALADQTHGQYVPIYSTASYGVALDRLADTLATQVMIDYLVPADSSAAEARVGIRIPGARVVGLGVSK